MSTNESDKMQAKEDIALYRMREEIAIYADQIQELAAENHKDTVVSLHLFSNYSEFFMLHSVEDGRLTGAYYYLDVPIFRADRYTPAEISKVLIDFVISFYHLRRSMMSESIFDDETYRRIGSEISRSARSSTSFFED